MNTKINDKMSFHDRYDFNDNRCLIEQYKIYLEMLEGSTRRRMDTNTFFITTNALIVTLTSLFNKGNALALCLICATGIAFSWIWCVLLRNYNVVNQAKWDVVNEMEEHLQCNPFQSEYPKMINEKYHSISVLERRLPIVFALVYVAIGLYGAYLFIKGGPNLSVTAAIAEVNQALSELNAALAKAGASAVG